MTVYDRPPVQLTATEHRLLRYLMEHANQVLSPQHLLEAVWDYPPNTGDPDLVRAHVRNLRAKLDKDSAEEPFIRTIHGVGYMISS
ncbi:MAG: helix-turn-helix domain-containing protein [Anaerolineae bacterium]|nr:helix-turn-helix domain-containing protein [Anaerolineae bacterium]